MVVASNNGSVKQKEFEKVLSGAIEILHSLDTKKATSLSSSDLEVVAAESIEKASLKLKIPLKVELISGTTFPDIICDINAGKVFGVEVKSTKSDSWECFGNSINESTRVENLGQIYVLFGKLGGHPAFKYGKYEDVLEEVKITHFPRYMVNMEATESVFDKMDVGYEAFRANPNKFKILKSYYRKKLKPGEELWWIDSEEASANIIKLWSEVEEEEKEEILADAFILFTELFRPKYNKKYDRLAGWLVSRYQLVSPSLRDNFSAGGQVEISGYMFPQVVGRLFESLDIAVERLSQIDRDDLAYYWGIDTAKVPVRKDLVFATWQTRVMNNLATDMDQARLNAFRKEVQKWFNKLT